MGSIQGESIGSSERERMQRMMREFIGAMKAELPQGMKEIAYKVHFWRPLAGARIDSLIELRAAGQDSWYARANGPDPWRSFCRALGSLKQILVEMELREDGNHASRNDQPA